MKRHRYRGIQRQIDRETHTKKKTEIKKEPEIQKEKEGEKSTSR